MVRNVTPVELEAYLRDADNKPMLLDVRENWEYACCHIVGSTHIPMSLICSRLEELNPDEEIIVVCHHGVRSWQVARYLANNGFSNVKNLARGVDGWAKEVDKSMPTY